MHHTRNQPNPIYKQAEADKFEVEIVNSANKAKEQGKHGIIYLPGSKEILDVVQTPGAKWAICTSAATRTYASAALKTVDLPLPAVFVTAGDVSKGKPWPEPYLLGAAKCGVDPSECGVWRGAEASRGIRVDWVHAYIVCVVRGENTIEQIKIRQPCSNSAEYGVPLLPPTHPAKHKN
ncbi:HAD-hyrolase-like, partial [Rhizoctonia solani]